MEPYAYTVGQQNLIKMHDVESKQKRDTNLCILSGFICKSVTFT